MARLIGLLFLIILPFSKPAFGSQPKEDFSNLSKVLREGDSVQKLNAIWHLRYTEDPRSVPLLIELLKSNEERIRAYSARELGFFKGSQSIDALEKALNDSSPLVRLYAAESLAKIGTEKHIPEIAPIFIKELSKNKEESVNFEPHYTILESIAKITKKAPPEIIAVLDSMPEKGTVGNWWILYESVADCLGEIGDKQALPALEKADKLLSENHQNYSIWYAVRKALSRIEPEKYKFDRPAADILNSFRSGKVTEESKINQGIIPIAKIGEDAIEDLKWALTFNQNYDDRKRSIIAIRALEYIGSQQASKVLSQYIENISLQNKEEGISKYKYLMEHAYVSLIKISSPEKVMDVLTQSDKLFGAFMAQYPVIEAINQLAEQGGQNSGDVLSKILLESDNQSYRMFAARALGEIQGYDSLPVLAKASESQNAPLADIARSLGMLNNNKAIPILEDISRNYLSSKERLWVAAALARFGRDYEKNAEFIRSNLPETLEQAEWLNDSNTIKVLENLIIKENNYFAFDTLKAIGTKDSFDTFTKAVANCETKIEPYKLGELFLSASQIAKKLNLELEEKEYTEKSITIEYVRRCFAIGIIPQSPSLDPNNKKIVSKHPQLARRIWITEAGRRFKFKSDSETSQISDSAVNVTELFFDKELVPYLEQIVKNSKYTVSFRTKDFKSVSHYYSRSLAAKILTEKTGKKYTFIDADGKEHPGGWYPGMEE